MCPLRLPMVLGEVAPQVDVGVEQSASPLAPMTLEDPKLGLMDSRLPLNANVSRDPFRPTAKLVMPSGVPLLADYTCQWTIRVFQTETFVT